MNSTKIKHRQPSGRHRQRGVVLFIALIVLVAMSLAGVSMMRSVDAGNKIAGNLALRQSATNAAEFAFEQAMAKVSQLAGTGLANIDNPGYGYSADHQSQAYYDRDWTTAWDLGTEPTTGNSVAIFIDRMCLGADCQTLSTATSAPDGVSHASSSVIQVTREQYRVLARVTSPQGMITFIEEKIY
jgi:type IV pilus assembly protein PilX